MRVFVAGASGAIGTRLVPQLIERGHEVIGTFRSPQKEARLRASGPRRSRSTCSMPRPCARPSSTPSPRRSSTRRRRSPMAGSPGSSTRPSPRPTGSGPRAPIPSWPQRERRACRRFVAQSFAPYRYAREGGLVKTEDDPLDAAPPAGAKQTFAAMAHLDQAVTDAGGIALRYGGFYGNSDDQVIKLVRKRRFPMIGAGEGVTSWIHLDDAAAATVLALEHDGAGIYNIVDDEPAPTREWLPALASALGAKPPRHIPAGLVRLIAGRRRGDGANPGSRCLQRQGEGRTGMDAALPQLAARFRGRLRVHLRRTANYRLAIGSEPAAANSSRPWPQTPGAPGEASGIILICSWEINARRATYSSRCRARKDH